MQQILLQASQLQVGYAKEKGNIILFKSINLTLQAGSLVCFMGPNGIGKSTLIRTLSGLQKPLQGTVSGNDEKNIALVLTDKIAGANMPVSELLSYGRYPYLGWDISLRDEDRHIIDQAVDDVHIRHLVDKKIEELSDGQMQMVMIARALAQDTPVLLLDEPTAHLDLNNRVEIMNLLKRLSRTRNKAILVATHELDLALQTADHVWLATPDQTIKTGIPEDLVLNGSFDEVFQFKGFDLKTGRVQQEAHRGKAIQLLGEGYQYRWVRNALERAGYDLSDTAVFTAQVSDQENLSIQFHDRVFNSVESFLHAVDQII